MVRDGKNGSGVREKLQFSCGNLFEIEVGENIAQRVLRRLMSTDSPPKEGD